MKKELERLEFFTDKLIPYLIFLLLFIIIIEIFYHDIAEKYKFEIGLLDGFIVFVFLVDLTFKYNRTKNIPQFIRRYWLEILAVFPFYLVFRFLELTIGFLEVSGVIKQGQNIFHTGFEIEKEAALISKEGSEIEKIGTRARALTRTFRTVSRVPRLVAAASFYEEPKLLKKVSAKTKMLTKRGLRKTSGRIKRTLKKIGEEIEEKKRR